MFSNLTIRGKLLLLTSIAIGLLLFTGLLGIYGLYLAKEELKILYTESVEETNLINILNNIYEEKLISTMSGVVIGIKSASEAIENYKTAKTEIEEIFRQYLSKVEGQDQSSNQRQLVEQIRRENREIAPLIDEAIAIFQSGDKEKLLSVRGDYFQKFSVPYQALLQLGASHIEDGRRHYREALDYLSALNLSIIIAFIVATIVLFLAAFYLINSITTPLNRAVEVINRLSTGDMNQQIEVVSEDEVGKLLLATKEMIRSSKKMSDNLTSLSKGYLSLNVEPRSEQDDLGKAFVSMTKNLTEIVGNIQEEVAILGASSQEIATSITQVSASTAETASAVTETSTTVEELKQTAHMSADKVKDVLANANETLQVVKNSEKSLEATIEGMNHIHEKMRMISQGIVKLSEHSQAIGEIIDTVNDLAEQSNLLAVNAAIEAATAQEHGKGFGVVAQEIRALAEQSKAATVQIKAILNDIQNATSAAVLATEQGAKAVEKGVAQSAQTNESMHALSQSISVVMQAANQIAISNQQQLVGIDQVAIAMNNINEATSQHVDHMKQIESVITSLTNVGNSLKELTDKYTVKK